MEQTESLAHQSHVQDRPPGVPQRARGRFDVIASMLTVAKEESRQTRIMYKCNLSYRQIKVYLDYLLTKGLMETGEVKHKAWKVKLFKTTEKGEIFLNAYRALVESLKER